ncbi:hypothetical protein ACFWNR_05245 [Streptomyces virginiae]|uniref:hypothetical protein n=1 Tax=Streptomyces virginiae TaxID=1961 RepID=UPI0036511791
MRHPDLVLRREQLRSWVSGFDHDPGSNIVDVFVATCGAGWGPDRVATIRGADYRLRTWPIVKCPVSRMRTLSP